MNTGIIKIKLEEQEETTEWCTFSSIYRHGWNDVSKETDTSALLQIYV